jgi:hypothetical protein
MAEYRKFVVQRNRQQEPAPSAPLPPPATEESGQVGNLQLTSKPDTKSDDFHFAADGGRHPGDMRQNIGFGGVFGTVTGLACGPCDHCGHSSGVVHLFRPHDHAIAHALHEECAAEFMQRNRQQRNRQQDDPATATADPSEPTTELRPLSDPSPAAIQPIPPALAKVELWRAGVAGLDPLIDPCPGFRTNSWSAIYRQIVRFLDSPLARIAAEAGWTDIELFGVHREVGAARFDTLGVLLVNSHGVPVTQVAENFIRLANGNAVRRVPMDQAITVPIWGFKPHQSPPSQGPPGAGPRV